MVLPPRPHLPEWQDGHRLSRGCLLYLWLAGIDVKDLSPYRRPVTVGAGTTEVWTEVGRSMRLTEDSSTAGVNCGDSGFLPTDGNITIAVSSKRYSSHWTGATAWMVDDGFAASGNRCNAHAPDDSGGTVYWDYGGFTGGSTRLSATSLLNYYGADYPEDFLVFTAGPRGMEIWHQGVLVASESGAAPTRNDTTGYDLKVGSNGTYNADDASHSFFAIWDRQLDEAEIRELSANPWCVVRDDTIAVPAATSLSVSLGSATGVCDTGALVVDGLTVTLGSAVGAGDTGALSVVGAGVTLGSAVGDGDTGALDVKLSVDLGSVVGDGDTGPLSVKLTVDLGSAVASCDTGALVVDGLTVTLGSAIGESDTGALVVFDTLQTITLGSAVGDADTGALAVTAGGVQAVSLGSAVGDCDMGAAIVDLGLFVDYSWQIAGGHDMLGDMVCKHTDATYRLWEGIHVSGDSIIRGGIRLKKTTNKLTFWIREEWGHSGSSNSTPDRVAKGTTLYHITGGGATYTAVLTGVIDGVTSVAGNWRVLSGNKTVPLRMTLDLNTNTEVVADRYEGSSYTFYDDTSNPHWRPNPSVLTGFGTFGRFGYRYAINPLSPEPASMTVEKIYPGSQYGGVWTDPTTGKRKRHDTGSTAFALADTVPWFMDGANGEGGDFWCKKPGGGNWEQNQSPSAGSDYNSNTWDEYGRSQHADAGFFAATQMVVNGDDDDQTDMAVQWINHDIAVRYLNQFPDPVWYRSLSYVPFDPSACRYAYGGGAARGLGRVPHLGTGATEAMYLIATKWRNMGNDTEASDTWVECLDRTSKMADAAYSAPMGVYLENNTWSGVGNPAPGTQITIKRPNGTTRWTGTVANLSGKYMGWYPKLPLTNDRTASWDLIQAGDLVVASTGATNPVNGGYRYGGGYTTKGHVIVNRQADDANMTVVIAWFEMGHLFHGMKLVYDLQLKYGLGENLSLVAFMNAIALKMMERTVYWGTSGSPSHPYGGSLSLVDAYGWRPSYEDPYYNYNGNEYLYAHPLRYRDIYVAVYQWFLQRGLGTEAQRAVAEMIVEEDLPLVGSRWPLLTENLFIGSATGEGDTGELTVELAGTGGGVLLEAATGAADTGALVVELTDEGGPILIGSATGDADTGALTVLHEYTVTIDIDLPQLEVDISIPAMPAELLRQFLVGIEVPDTEPVVWGDPETEGAWRIIRSGDNLLVQRYESSSWVTKSTITP